MSHTDRHDSRDLRTHFEENEPASPIVSIVLLATLMAVAFGAMAMLQNVDTSNRSPTVTPPATQPATPPASVPAPARSTSP